MIEIGDYVRIDKDHRIIALGIAKVVKTINETIYVKNNFELPITIDKNSISKHSKNLIDLIEVRRFRKWISYIRTNIQRKHYVRN